MRKASLLRWLVPRATMGVAGAVLISLSTPTQAHRVKTGPDCESGVLDPGEGGVNVLTYQLCSDRLTIGFKSSDVVEEVSCRPSGNIRLWLSAGDTLCDRLPASDRDQVHELWKPLAGIGRSTVAPVQQLLFCPAGTMNRATMIVPDARAALLETRTGDSRYEAMTRRLIASCIRPDA
jgi:hypothetical protein